MIIKEDADNIYIEDYIIPKGREKIYIKERECVIWSILSKWLSQNPLKRKTNVELNDYIYLRFDGMQETVNKAARNYKSTMAVFQLDFILANATKVGTDKPQSKRQEKFSEMIIMNVITPIFFPYFDKVKMLVGVTKQKKSAKKIQYSITAIESEK
ncbi:MAG: hypothetical protein FWC34_08110 [Bacteroidetes bacterium]|nr:hypothetical protein [Bacteroidota bacterium]MCL2301664.1 hypothetical protein [Lentimicrobiaceae bacterium]